MNLKLRTILSLVILGAAAHAVGAQGTVMNWTIDGVIREALVFAPEPATNDFPHPVVFAWHGYGGNMQVASQLMHIQTVWPEAIVVYAQGLPTQNPVHPNLIKPGWQTVAGENGDRDLKLFDAMLATIKQTHSVDDARIYTTGFSNGGVFSYLLWAERGERIAAIGEVAGRLFLPEHLTLPRPLLAVAGKNDTIDLTALQQQTIDEARQVDNATGNGQSCGQFCTFYASTSQTPVKTFIHPGGHFYPPGAPGEIVKFFKNHHL
jgi:polyhydroxybutyrate depolymerase